MEVTQESCNQSTAAFPHSEEIVPVDLYNKHPHRQLGLWAVLEAGDEPLHIMVSIQEVFGIEVGCKSNAVRELVGGA